MAVFILTIPAATAFAPHQNSLDKRYYRRFEARAVPMHDYEIRDLLRRGQLPELRAAFAFADGRSYQVLSHDDPILDFLLTVENVSSEPALYCLFDFMFDKRLTLVDDAGLKRMNDFAFDDYRLHKLQKISMVPNDFPLLRGATMSFGPPFVRIEVPSQYLQSNEKFLIGYAALTSGYSQSRFQMLSLENGVASIEKVFATLGTTTVLGD
jgi:hypothetical protein